MDVPESSYGELQTKIAVENVTRLQSPTLATFTSQNNKTNSIIFVGDVMMARNVEFLMDEHGSEYPFKGINFNETASNPYVVGNFEATIPKSHVPTKNQQMRFSVAAGSVQSLFDAGFTHLSLANNHGLDFGPTSLLHTQEVLQNVGVSWFGHPQKVSTESTSFVTINDIEVAIIGLHALNSVPSEEVLKEIFSYASARSDMQIVYVHWGIEYDAVSSIAQQQLAQTLVQAGADLIIGHHPHVVQEIDLIAGVPVFYSLGNYIFDQYFSKAVQTGMLLQLDTAGEIGIHILPVQSSKKISQPSYMSNVQHADFLQSLSESSHVDLQTEIKNGYIPLRMQVASSPEIAMIKE
jgi:poly-gamma-glutamate synthesis protein (capsule biosynthesis protein)